MSFESITIFRDFPVIRGSVQLPPNREQDKTKFSVAGVIAAVPTAELMWLNPSGRATTGSRFGTQQFVRIPSTYTADECCSAIGSSGEDVLARVAEDGTLTDLLR